MNTIDIKIPIEAPKEKPSTLSFEQLQQRIDKALHRIQLLQMDGEVTIRDLGLILRDLKGEDK